jgi:hypothetical protein
VTASRVACARRARARIASTPRESSVEIISRVFRSRESDSRRAHHRDQKVTPHDEFCSSP